MVASGLKGWWEYRRRLDDRWCRDGV